MIRNFLARLAFLALPVLLAACHGDPSPWHMTDVAGSLPPLAFSMERANDGAAVTAKDYRGRVVLLYFGYTHCPDICPTTLADLSTALGDLKQRARDVAVLFVTVDPGRDKPAILGDYVRAFAPEIDGLRGSPDDLLRLARRYRVAFSVTPAPTDEAYEVTHSSAVFVFGKDGRARLVATSTQDPAGIAADLRRLADEPPPA